MKSTSLIKLLFGLAIATIFTVAIAAFAVTLSKSGVIDKLSPSPSPEATATAAAADLGQLDLNTYVQPEKPVRIEDYFYYTDIPVDVKSKMIGSSYPKVSDGVIVSLNDLAYVKLRYVDFDGNDQDGEIIVHKVVAQEVVDIFQGLYEARYPIGLVALVDEFGADDIKSMEANNSCGFNYRVVAGTTTLSNHAYGLAVDINPIYNPYVKKKSDGSDYVSPAIAKDYVKERDGEYCIDKDDLAYQLFTSYGWGWGGDYKSLKDYMHFEKDPSILSEVSKEPQDSASPAPSDIPEETIITTEGVITIEGQVGASPQPSQKPGEIGNTSQSPSKELVVVIDPGHGGTNEGADYGTKEKYLTMKTAAAMKAQLEFYDNVKVYLTHASAEDNMSIEDRVKYAKSVNADILVSLHFNASENHDKWGSEVWIPQSGDENRLAYGYAKTVLGEWETLGLHNRGIKTRSGNQGEYYGILRYGVENGIASAILEHAHVDNAKDKDYVNSDLAMARFGAADANAIAKYFGLSSQRLGVSYTGNKENYTQSNLLYAKEDLTPPTVVIDSVSADGSKLKISLTATEPDSPLMMFSYSLDGGASFTNPQVWPESSPYMIDSPNSITLSVPVSSTYANIVVKAYNLYDRVGTSAEYKWGVQPINYYNPYLYGFY